MSGDQSIHVKAKGTFDSQGVEDGLGRIGNKAKQTKKELIDLEQLVTSIGKSGWSKLTSLAAGGLAGGAMYQRIDAGGDRYKKYLIDLDTEARTVKQLGQAYREYHREILAVGRAHGYSNGEVVALQSQLARAGGRAYSGRLLDDMKVSQGMGRAYGMSALESGAVFSKAASMGMTTKGGDVSPRQFAAMIADAVVVGQMQGREGEVIASMQQLVEAVNSKTPTVGGTALSASALATLNATGIRGLQGEQGAGLLSRLNSAIMSPGGGEAGELFMYRSLAGNTPGALSLADYEYSKEEGLAGKTADGRSNLQAVMENINQMPIGGRYRLMAARQLTGLSMHQYEEMERAFFKDGKFQTAALGGLTEAVGGEQNLNKIDTSWWGLLSEVANGGDIGAAAKEFEQLSGQKPVSSTDRQALLKQIGDYGQGNVALSEGQAREKLDNDIGKASEDAASQIYELKTAADQFTKWLIETTGSVPVAGGVLPILAAGGAAWGMSKAGTWAAGAASTFGLNQAAKHIPLGINWGGSLTGEAAATAGSTAVNTAGKVASSSALVLGPAQTWKMAEPLHEMAVKEGRMSRLDFEREKAKATKVSWGEWADLQIGGLGASAMSMFGADTSDWEAHRAAVLDKYVPGEAFEGGSSGGSSTWGETQKAAQAFTKAVTDESERLGEDFGARFWKGMENALGPVGRWLSDTFGVETAHAAEQSHDHSSGGHSGGSAKGKGIEGVMRSMLGDNARMTSDFDDHRTINGKDTLHGGVDFAAAEGTDIRAVEGGEVITNEYNEKLNGNYVQIRDEQGRVHYYGHMQNRSQLKVGSKVGAGDVIGQVGKTGMASGPHVHYQIRDANGNLVDPEQAYANAGAAAGTNIDTSNVNPQAAKAIDTMLGARSTPSMMVGQGANILAMAEKYNVPPELALSMFAKEAQFASKGSKAHLNNNPGNIRFVGQEGATRGEGGFAKWGSMEEGIEAYFKLMDSSYRQFLDKGDIDGLVNKYAPPSENNSDLYSKQMKEWMAGYRKMLYSSRGGWWEVPGDETPTMLHRKEMVLPAHLAEPIREMAVRPGISAAEAKGAAQQIHVTFDPITINWPGGSTTVQPRGQYRPFAGVIDQPIGGSA